MKICILGSRGIPAKYGGFESFTEQLSLRLASKRYPIYVSCEYTDAYKPDYFHGVKLTYFPLSPPKFYSIRKLYEVLSDIYFLIVMSRQCDIIYVLGVGTAGCFTFIPKIFNKKLIVNIDGLEWERKKFNKLEKLFLKFNNRLAIHFSDLVIIDSQSLMNFIDKNSKNKVHFIPYGVESMSEVHWHSDMLNKLFSKCKRINSISPGNYWLVIARLEPENNIDLILKGFLLSKSKKKLVIVGNPSSKNYERQLKKYLMDDIEERVLMVGAIYDGSLLNMLRQNCFAYIHGHSVGGTNPSLLEAMISKCIILANDNIFNREVCGSYALYFKNLGELKANIDLIEKDYPNYTYLKELTFNRALEKYSWLKIVDNYESVFNRV